MALSHMQVFNEYIMPATFERLAQNVQAFNAASGGAIVLTADGFAGDFNGASFWNNLGAAQRRVGLYGANTPVTPIDLTQGKRERVKVAGGFGPVRFEPAQLAWLNKPTGEAISVASQQFADLLMLDHLNTGIMVAVAAVGNQAAVTRDISALTSGAGGISHAALNETDALFGDASQSLRTRFMTGATYHKLIGRNLTNTQMLFQAGNVQVVDVLGKAYVVLDAPALTVAGTPTKSRILTLTTGGVEVTDNADVISNIQTVNGNQRIETTIQMDYSFALAIKGYTWDTVNGGKSPDNAKLGTGSNWDLIVDSIKHQAGTLLVVDAAQ
jgi:hypothetical protein